MTIDTWFASPEPETPGLTGGDIDIWKIGLDAGPEILAASRRLLSESESARAARYRRPADGERFTVAHGRLRVILGRYAGIRPEALEFAAGKRGKPRLVRAGQCEDLSFSLSYAGAMAIVAVAAGREVGVDAEPLHAENDLPLLAEACLSPAERALFDSATPARRARLFYTFWTRKEAYLKAQGVGLGVEPRTVDLSTPGPTPDGRWFVRDIGDDYPFPIALATECPPGCVRVMELT